MSGERDLFGQVSSPVPTRPGNRRLFIAAPLRAHAEAMRKAEASLESIALALGISIGTVRKRLKAELEAGMPGGRPAGRPRWRPSDDDRARVEQLAASGDCHDAIAAAIGVSAPTLRRHCAAELAKGRRSRQMGLR